jgi:hypothetical protein
LKKEKGFWFVTNVLGSTIRLHEEMMLSIDIQFAAACTQLFSSIPKEKITKKRFRYTTNHLTSRFKVKPTVFSEIG